MNMFQKIRKYFDLKNKIKELEKRKTELNNYFISYEEIKEQRDSAYEEIKDQRWSVVESNRELALELQEYKDKYSLLRAAVLGEASIKLEDIY